MSSTIPASATMFRDWPGGDLGFPADHGRESRRCDDLRFGLSGRRNVLREQQTIARVVLDGA